MLSCDLLGCICTSHAISSPTATPNLMPLLEVCLILGLTLLIGTNGHVCILLAIPYGAVLSGHPYTSSSAFTSAVHKPLQPFRQDRLCMCFGSHLGVPHEYTRQPCLLLYPSCQVRAAGQAERKEFGKEPEKDLSAGCGTLVFVFWDQDALIS